MAAGPGPVPPLSSREVSEAITRALVHVFSWRSAISAALLAASEYAMLSLIEDAPRSLKFATMISPVAAFLVIQFETPIRRIWSDLFPILLILLALGYAGFGAYVFVSPTQIVETFGVKPSPRVAMASPSLTPPKYYSPAEKVRLLDALDGLNDLLLSKLPKPVDGMMTFAELTNRQTNSVSTVDPNPKQLIELLKGVNSALNDFDVSLGAFLGQSSLNIYHDEFASILGRDYMTFSRVFREGIANIMPHLTVLDAAVAYHDKNLNTAALVAMQPSTGIAVDSGTKLARWGQSARSRIDDLKRSLSTER